MRVIWIALLGVALLAGSAAGASKGGSVALVAYSTPKDAFGQIIPAFQKTPAGKGVDFTQSYGASGDQAQAVAAGLPADVVDLSLEPGHRPLVKAGPRREELEREQVQGHRHRLGRRLRRPRRATRSTSRAGTTWSSRASQVITPNPFTSGGARWNVLAAYGAQLKRGKTTKQASAT